MFDVLVMMRSGKEHRLCLSDEQVEELRSHVDIGPGRVYIIRTTDDEAEAIPWHKMFPGIVLATTQRMLSQLHKDNAGPRAPRARKNKFVQPVAPSGPIQWYSGNIHGAGFKQGTPECSQ
jgi:hypothetical protein